MEDRLTVRLLKSFTVCFVAWCFLQAFQSCIPPLERFTEALRADCAVAVPGGPRLLNGGKK